MGISRIFDISRRTLATYQRALDVTAHNIANSSNPFYSRQVSIISTEPPEINKGFTWGTGVKIDQVLRVRDNLTDSQLRVNYQRLGDNNKRSESLGQIETLFSEPSELGLSGLMNSFFNTFNELSVTPNSIPLRQNVIQAAQKISSKVKTIYEGIDTVKSDVLNEAVTKVEDINRYLKQIQTLNSEIYSASAVGQTPNDLLDNRDKLIDELSTLVNIHVTMDDKGTANISIGGITAVDLTNTNQFKLETVNGELSLVTIEGNNRAAVNGGEFFALSETYSKKIPEYIGKLDAILNTLVNAVNGEHSKGHSLGDPPATGINFFDSYSDGNLKINSEILNDPSMIAVSSDGTSGNGDIALLIASLSDKKLIEGNSLTDSYSNFISGMGNDKLTADMTAEANLMVVQQLEIQRASYSGVSVDEEMTNMIKYQRTYDAAAKLISVADEMLETLLNLV